MVSSDGKTAKTRNLASVGITVVMVETVDREDQEAATLVK